MKIQCWNAECERDLIRDGTDVGRKAALERGVKFGRPTKMTDQQLKLAKKLLRQGESVHYVADMFGVHFTTLYRYIRMEAFSDRVAMRDIYLKTQVRHLNRKVTPDLVRSLMTSASN